MIVWWAMLVVVMRGEEMYVKQMEMLVRGRVLMTRGTRVAPPPGRST